MTEDVSGLGRRLKSFREQRGWTQAELAQHLTAQRGWSVTQAQVSTWETGEHSMSPGTARFVRSVIEQGPETPKQAS